MSVRKVGLACGKAGKYGTGNTFVPVGCRDGGVLQEPLQALLSVLEIAFSWQMQRDFGQMAVPCGKQSVDKQSQSVLSRTGCLRNQTGQMLSEGRIIGTGMLYALLGRWVLALPFYQRAT